MTEQKNYRVPEGVMRLLVGVIGRLQVSTGAGELYQALLQCELIEDEVQLAEPPKKRGRPKKAVSKENGAATVQA